MRKHIAEFCKRGLLVCGGGPLIVAIIFLCINAAGVDTTLGMAEAAKNIITSLVMAFVAAGITVVYQIEELPLFPALLLHGFVLYLDYLFFYLVNGWLAEGAAPFLVFTAIFVVGYALVWCFIYLVTKSKTKALNEVLNR